MATREGATAKIERAQAIGAIENAPFAILLGLKVESAADGQAIARLPFSPRMLNGGGEQAPIHGGAIAALIDFAACCAIWSMPRTVRSATVGMTVNYTAAGIQSDLVAHARVRRAGVRIASLTVEVFDVNDELIADALVTYKIS
jgi:uncharacterized protein (TIGR00369 family)